MTTAIRMELSGTSVAISKRAQRRVDTEAHRAAGRYWDRNYVAMHFTRLAAGRYGYQERADYTKRRKKQLAKRGVVQKGGSVSLVHTGLLERTMTRQHVIRAFPTRVTIPMPATSYINARPRGNQPNMAREITTVIDSERDKIGEASQEAHDKFTEKEVANNRYKFKTK